MSTSWTPRRKINPREHHHNFNLWSAPSLQVFLVVHKNEERRVSELSQIGQLKTSDIIEGGSDQHFCDDIILPGALKEKFGC
jgi:hypothetical protein